MRIRGNGKASWLGLQNRTMQKYAYEFCFPVATVIDRLAEYDLTGHLEINKIKGKGRDKEATSSFSNDLRRLFERPNPLQSWAQFRGQQVAYKKTHGFCPILSLTPTGFKVPSMMINIPPWCIEPIMPKSFLGATTMDEIVSEWKITILDKTIVVKSDRLFFVNDGFTQDERASFVLPLSRLVGLDMAVSNICAAMEADNVILKKRGPQGFISHDAAATKDSQVGYIPMTKTEKGRVQKELQNYGLSLDQYLYAVTRSAVKWVPIGSSIKDLETRETVVAGEKAICHRFSFPYVLYEETDTTYANGDNAIATVYQTNVIPNAERDMLEYSRFFKAREQDCEICLDYCHVGALQEDELAKSSARKAKNEAMLIEFQNNLITLNQWREALGIDPTDDGDVYYKDVKQEPAITQNENTPPKNIGIAA